MGSGGAPKIWQIRQTLSLFQFLFVGCFILMPYSKNYCTIKLLEPEHLQSTKDWQLQSSIAMPGLAVCLTLLFSPSPILLEVWSRLGVLLLENKLSILFLFCVELASSSQKEMESGQLLRNLIWFCVLALYWKGTWPASLPIKI